MSTLVLGAKVAASGKEQLEVSLSEVKHSRDANRRKIWLAIFTW